MKNRNIIFLGIIKNEKEFYSIFGEYANQEIPIVCEDVRLYKNIITITEKEIKEYFGDYKSIEELRKKAIKFFAENIQGKFVDVGEYKNIRISRNARDRYKKYSYDERKLLIIPKLLDLLKEAKYKNSSLKYKERKDCIFKFHYFTNEVMVYDKKDNNYKEYKVYITIGEDENGKLFYDLNKNKTSEE